MQISPMLAYPDLAHARVSRSRLCSRIQISSMLAYPDLAHARVSRSRPCSRIQISPMLAYPDLAHARVSSHSAVYINQMYYCDICNYIARVVTLLTTRGNIILFSKRNVLKNWSVAVLFYACRYFWSCLLRQISSND